VTEVLSVRQIDGQTIGAGRPGPMAERLRTQLEKRAGGHTK
jgi:branched-subunit amino acid aminotransferase/4-amino-4-deoxychorismate lyase